MAMLWEMLGVVALAMLALVLLMLVIGVNRLLHLRWRPAQVHTLERDAIPDAIRKTLDQGAAELQALGFVYRSSAAVDRAIVMTKDRGYFDLYQHQDGHTHAMLSPWPVPNRSAATMVQLITCLNDGNHWLTLNCGRFFSPMTIPRWQVFDDYLPHGVQAWQRHLARVQAQLQQAPGSVCTDTVQVQQRLAQSFEDLVPQMAQRGELVALADSPYYRLTGLAALRFTGLVLVGQMRAAWAQRHAPTAPAQPRAADAPTEAADATQAELQAFEAQRSLRASAGMRPQTKWWLFAITAVLFLLVGGAWFSWSFVPILLAVIALHEGGHYLAMRLTGYRNVSVFFLPGLGGLATGEKATATPPERLFVYLAGPVPGIVLAGTLLWLKTLGIWEGPIWVNDFIMTALVINYLNLLPLVPLDGGRVLETLVFSRAPRLRFGFAALCCAVLLALGIALDDTVLKVLAVFIALGLPHQWRLMRLDLAIARSHDQALAEPQALQHIFAALQAPAFATWSFAKRAAAATALLPELLGRRPRLAESALGLLIYLACLAGPWVLLAAAVPQWPLVARALGPALALEADDVDPATDTHTTTPPTDWNAKLANTTLSPDERLQALLGAGQDAYNGEDNDTARTHYLAAWALAQDLPPRDLRRIAALEGLANSAETDAEQGDYLARIVQALDNPQGSERAHLATAKEQQAQLLPDPAGRVTLLREALTLRPAPDPARSSTQLSLAYALDAAQNAPGAEALLRQRLDDLPQPDPGERSRAALEQRSQRVLAQVDIVWFLLAHQRAPEALALATDTLQALPAKTTVSWIYPQQRAAESAVWSALLAQDTTALAQHWPTHEAAQARNFAGDRRPLFMDIDSALVGQALNNTSQLAKARDGVTQTLARLPRGASMLCQPPRMGNHPNWHAPQQDARRQWLTSTGACPP